MPYLNSADNTALFFRDWGHGDPIVFVHGWGLNSDMWEYQLPALGDGGHRCIAYDRRGCGRSDQPGDGYDFDTLADDLAAVLDHLDLRDVTLVSHSMGSGEVARYLTRHGTERISRVALISPTLPYLRLDESNPEGVDPALGSSKPCARIARATSRTSRRPRSGSGCPASRSRAR